MGSCQRSLFALLTTPGSLGRFLVAVKKFQDKFASLRQKRASLAEVSLKYVELTCIW